MSLNKKILVLAIAGLLPAASYAGVNLHTDGSASSTPPIFAEETPVPGSNLQNLAPVSNNILDVTTDLGFSIVGSSKYIRFDFPGTKLATALTAANFSTTPPSGLFTVSAGGTVGSSFVVVELSGANLSNANLFNFRLDPVPALTPDAKTAHTITYRLYETASEAANNVTASALATSTGNWYTFGKALELSCTPAASKKIDVTSPKLFTDGTVVTPLFGLTAKIAGAGVFTNLGNPVAITNYLPNGSTFTTTGHVGDIIGGGSLTLGGTPAVILPTTGTWTTPTPALDYLDLPVVLTTDGLLNMLAGNYGVVVQPGAGALNAAPIDLGVCGTLAFSGSSDRVDYSLTPNAPTGNKQFLRITNPTATSGAVTVTMWNDDGQQVDFPLSLVTVAGVPLPGILNHHASTRLIDINDFFVAAQAKDATFNVVGPSKKLRILVRGAFGDDQIDGVRNPGNIVGKASAGRLQDGIYIQSLANGTFLQGH
ncbi:MAG: hypothetical protein PHR16_14195 [Methylovulum sp.]|nr:hypothetical protein [Methylovulum sp.]